VEEEGMVGLEADGRMRLELVGSPSEQAVV